MLFIIVIACVIFLMYLAVKKQATKAGSAILLLGPGFLANLLSGIYIAWQTKDPWKILDTLINPLEFYDQQIVFGNTLLGLIGTAYWVIIFAGAWYLAFSIFFVDPKSDRRKALPISLSLGLITTYALGGLRYTVIYFYNIIVISFLLLMLFIIDYYLLRWYINVRRRAYQHIDTRDSDIRLGGTRRTVRIRPLQILQSSKKGRVREEDA